MRKDCLFELKDGVSTRWSEEVYYDLTDGGYLKPEDFLKNEKDIVEVLKALEIVKKYVNSVVTGYMEDEEEEE
jgi:hypothetical protein